MFITVYISIYHSGYIITMVRIEGSAIYIYHHHHPHIERNIDERNNW